MALDPAVMIDNSKDYANHSTQTDQMAFRHGQPKEPLSVGVLIREQRVNAGLTQRQLAAAASVSIGVLRDLEQGRTRCPRWATVAAIASSLRMDQDHCAELASAWHGGRTDDGIWEARAGTQANGGPAGIWIGVLGPLMVTRDGAIVGELGSARQRVVLGLLALHWPAGASMAVIVDVLWGERPPASATTQVQACISKLRCLLYPRLTVRERQDTVMLAGRCYRLGEGMELDQAVFGQLVRRADAAVAQGEPRLACRLYERSLGLWRGEVLADLDLLQDLPVVVELTHRRDDVVQRLASVGAACGWHERVLPHLRALCARDPYNEQAHAQLMAALATTGQQVAALRVFDEIRHRLDRTLGIRPGPQLVAARMRIRRQQASLPADDSPRPGVTATGHRVSSPIIRSAGIPGGPAGC
jgi:DNA-binding SARP family transcriptional activator/DNA-binding XRE family transcriptional regulator